MCNNDGCLAFLSQWDIGIESISEQINKRRQDMK